jgi:sensor histidine kinase YesM
MELLSFSLVNGIIMTSGLLLNIFVYLQLSGKIRKIMIHILIILSSAGFSISGLLYITFNHPLFFLYGIEVLVSYILIIFIIITALSFFSCGFFNYQKLVEKEKAGKEMEKRLREEMERQIYSSRINPHFLFNSLNLMISLLDDKEKAEEVLIGLSELLRYNLDASQKESIPLNDEINSIKKYLFIQQQRFGKRLDYTILGEAQQEIPPMLLQPLVENSIKHNMDYCNYIKINIRIKQDNQWLCISVKDSEAKLHSDMIGQGTGLELTRIRVEMYKGLFVISDGGINICLPVK